MTALLLARSKAEAELLSNTKNIFVKGKLAPHTATSMFETFCQISLFYCVLSQQRKIDLTSRPVQANANTSLKCSWLLQYLPGRQQNKEDLVMLSEDLHWMALEKNTGNTDHLWSLQSSGKWKMHILIENNGICRLRKVTPSQSVG